MDHVPLLHLDQEIWSIRGLIVSGPIGRQPTFHKLMDYQWPRSLVAAAGPALGGVLMASGLLSAPLLACGILKISYDLVLLYGFRSHKGEPEGATMASSKPE